MQNIKKRGRGYEQNIKPEYLDQINKGYFNFIKSYPEQNNLVIELGDLDFIESQNDYETIIEQIQNFAVLLPA